MLPDVVKLDRAMITDPGGTRYDETMSFVADYAAFTGARVIAEASRPITTSSSPRSPRPHSDRDSSSASLRARPRSSRRRPPAR